MRYWEQKFLVLFSGTNGLSRQINQIKKAQKIREDRMNNIKTKRRYDTKLLQSIEKH